ncbi:MAG TPA: sulfatase-like hydrolase/transferase [Planctomycetota bacterium]
MPARLVLAACALALAACAREPARPSVVLVLVDQLRHDAAERWLVETRALAEHGVRCEAMRAVAPWTYPSVISLFSGLYPQQHGANANQEGTLLATIDEAVPLLPRTLRAAGYHTAGFVTNPFLHESNRPVRAGFEHFDASFIGDQGMTRGHGERVWTERMFADTVNAAVRAHFDARPRAGPEFVYVHYIDVHGRREGPERWQGAPFAPSYEAAVRFVDGKIRELYDYFHARYGGELLFVVTSDHGQDLEDDLAVGDGPPLRQRKASLHDFNLRIPFYVLPGAPLAGPAVLREPCANVDVAPTLLEWLGLPPQGPGPGRSLLPAIRAGGGGEAHVLYARNETGGRFEECLLEGGRKLLRYRDPRDGSVRVRRLFDLAGDPREVRGLSADPAALETRLEQLADPQGLAYPARFEELDPETRAHLDALGYGGK